MVYPGCATEMSFFEITEVRTRTLRGFEKTHFDSAIRRQLAAIDVLKRADPQFGQRKRISRILRIYFPRESSRV